MIGTALRLNQTLVTRDWVVQSANRVVDPPRLSSFWNEELRARGARRINACWASS